MSHDYSPNCNCRACGAAGLLDAIGSNIAGHGHTANCSCKLCCTARLEASLPKRTTAPIMALLPRLVYMAHPVSGDVPANLARAKRWLAWLMRQASHGDVVIAPWLHEIELGRGDDSDPRQRELGLLRDEAAVARCDALVLVGGRVSEGMKREAAVAKQVIDWTHLGEEPPT